jgi:hypothetical protein
VVSKHYKVTAKKIYIYQYKYVVNNISTPPQYQNIIKSQQKKIYIYQGGRNVQQHRLCYQQHP